MGLKERGSQFVLGLGTIATGVQGNEPLLSKKSLKRDLTLAKNLGVREVVIFRLGGLNKKYKEVLEEFV